MTAQTIQTISAEQASIIAQELIQLKKINSDYPLNTRSDFNNFINKVGTCFEWKSLMRIAQSPKVLDLLLDAKDIVKVTSKGDLCTRMYTVTFESSGKSASYQY